MSLLLTLSAKNLISEIKFMHIRQYLDSTNKVKDLASSYPLSQAEYRSPLDEEWCALCSSAYVGIERMCDEYHMNRTGFIGG